MATRPGRKGEIPKRSGVAGIGSRNLATSSGMPLVGKAERHDQNHTAIYGFIRYTGAPADTSRPFETSADVLISVGRPVSVPSDALVRVTRGMDVTADTFQRITRSVDLSADVTLWVRHNVSIPASTPRPVEPALEFLGKGLRFPFTFQRRSGGAQISTATSSDHAHIHESIRQILGTRRGERFMRPEFGTRLHELVFEPNDRLLYGLVRHEVIEALDEWEPRIVVTDVAVGPSDTDEHLVLVDIRYRLISAQVTGNLVYPLYRELE